MPIPSPYDYYTLLEVYCKGKCVSLDVICARCHSKCSFYFTGSSVSRSGVIPGSDGSIVFIRLQIFIAICRKCHLHARVLPRELLPRKTFGLKVIETAFRNTLVRRRTLRKAVAGIVQPAGHCPSYSTLWRWLDGFGERILDRNDWIKFLYPPLTSSVLMESFKRNGVNVADIFLNTVVEISPIKYRSPRREDQLSAVARLLVAADSLFPDHTGDALERWNLFLIPTFSVAVWVFPTSFPKTPMQQAIPP